MNIRSRSVAFLLGMTVPFGALAQSRATLTMEVTPRLVASRDLVVDFWLSSTSSVPMSIEKSSWFGGEDSSPISITAEQFPDFASQPFVACPAPLERIIISDPSPGAVQLPPKGGLRATVIMSTRYKNIQDIIGKCDLVLTWSYRLYLDEGPSASRMAGVVVIPASLRPLTTHTTTVDVAVKDHP